VERVIERFAIKRPPFTSQQFGLLFMDRIFFLLLAMYILLKAMIEDSFLMR